MTAKKPSTQAMFKVADRIRRDLARLDALVRVKKKEIAIREANASLPTIGTFEVARAAFANAYWLKLSASCKTISDMAKVSGLSRASVRNYLGDLRGTPRRKRRAKSKTRSKTPRKHARKRARAN